MRFPLISLLVLAAVPGSAASEIAAGPMLGKLTSTSVAVWARTAEPGAFSVRYGPSLGTLDRVAGPAETKLEDDNTGVVELRDLEPGTTYYYQVFGDPLDGRTPENTGRFRTLPAPERYRNATHNPGGLFNFSFEFACGNNQNSNPELPAFSTMLREAGDEIAFAIQNGDWVYEEMRDYPPADWLRQTGAARAPRIVDLAPSIVGVWENYKLYLRRGGPLRAWHRNVPSFFTFDDHELLGDVNGTGTIGLRSRRAAFRDIGVRGWYDYLGWANHAPQRQQAIFGRARLEQGSDVLEDPGADFVAMDPEELANLTVHWGGPTAGVNEKELDETGGDPNAGVYAIEEVLGRNRLRIRPAARASSEVSYSVGRLNYWSMRVSNAEFFYLDTRSHRQLHDIAKPFDPDVSLLGERQKAWLKRSMRQSDADFHFLVSSVNLMIPHVGPGMAGPNKDEAWTAIAAERNEMIDFWDGLGKPVFVLTGDLHNSFAIKITDRVWEFASGPHNSGNHPAASEASRPPNGMFESRGKPAEIRWSTYFLDDSAAPRRQPVYCIVRLQNVFNNPGRDGQDRWVAYPQPQAIFQYFSGLTGDLLYAESVLASAR